MRNVTRRSITLSAVLAAIAGYVDALGFISTGGYFVSFMSGNSTQAAVEAVQGEFSAVLFAVSLVVSFVVGVVLGGLLQAQTTDTRASRPRILWLAAAALTLTAALGMSAAVSEWRFTCVALAMGALNTLFMNEGKAQVAITYATGTLVSVGFGLADAIRGNKNSAAWLRPLLMWSSLTLGAALGAACLLLFGEIAMIIAAAVLVAVALSITVVLNKQRSHEH